MDDNLYPNISLMLTNMSCDDIKKSLNLRFLRLDEIENCNFPYIKKYNIVSLYINIIYLHIIILEQKILKKIYNQISR